MNKDNVTRLRDAIAASTDFNMCDFPTCNVGHAARLEGRKLYSDPDAVGNRELLYDSVDLCAFLGIEASQTNRNTLMIALGKLFTDRIGPHLEDITAEDAVGMLDNLLSTGEPLWPWEVS